MSLLGLLAVRLWFLQVIDGDEYRARADDNRLRVVRQDAPRGPIVDRNGELLVGIRPGFDVVASPSELADGRRAEVLGRLARVLKIGPARLEACVRAAADSPLASATLAEDVPAPIRFYLAQRARQFPGIHLRQVYPRVYLAGTSLSHVLGYTGSITPDLIDGYRKKGYLGDERVGVSGLEASYEEHLVGRPGETTLEVDAAGEPVRLAPLSSTIPQRGRTLELSIDLSTQRALDAALRDQVALSGNVAGAAGVAIAPGTGEILALSSLPSYRADAFSEGRGRAVDRLLKDRRRPLLNRAMGGLYPAGSTFKVVTAAAAIEAHLLRLDDLLPSPGELTFYGLRFRGFENRSWGDVDVRRALEVSSDTFFYQLGDRFYRDGNRTPLQDWARRFGLGAPTGIDVGGEVEGLVPDPAWKRTAFEDSPDPLDKSWKPGDSINLSTGQGNLLVTPLQMARAYAAIANGGRLVTPRIGRRVLDATGRPLKSLIDDTARRRLGVAPESLDALRDGLLAAANSPDGTSTAVFGSLPPDARVAGKTGTAENETGVDHSWYVGYAPADDPRIVVAVVIEQGGQGANAAAPAACQTITTFLRAGRGSCGAGARAN